MLMVHLTGKLLFFFFCKLLFMLVILCVYFVSFSFIEMQLTYYTV